MSVDLTLLAFALSAALAGCNGAEATDTNPPAGPCKTFDDDSAPMADRTVSFGGEDGSGPFSYSPMCMEIAKGQSVVFKGDFSVHPLTPGSAPNAPKSGSIKNPIPLTSTGETKVTVEFANAGTYPYYCGQHFAAGMVGEIDVVD